MEQASWLKKQVNNSYLELQAWSRKTELGLGWGPKLPNHVPNGILPPASPYLLSTPKDTYWGKNIQILKKKDDFSSSIHFLVVDCTGLPFYKKNDVIFLCEVFLEMMQRNI